MKRLIYLLLFITTYSYSQQLELPKPLGGEIEHYTGYSLEYNEAAEQPFWIAYELTSEEVNGTLKRKDSFKYDPHISTGSATLSDYSNSGFDRGHLAPAADMKWNKVVMSESFYMSNMSPQVPGFNRGIWKKLEEQVRNWAIENEKLLITTGPIITKGYKTIGKNKVAVPSHYYKVIADITEPDIKAIGFILPNEKSNKPLTSFAVSIDKVEEITGIDFFYQLSDNIENHIESKIDVNKWSWNKKFSKNKVIEKQPVKSETSATPIKYWINTSNNTRHNPSCRYYGKTKNGYYTEEKVGKPMRCLWGIIYIMIDLKNEKIELLSEVADVKKPKPDKNITSKILSPANFTYPLRISNLKEGKATKIELENKQQDNDNFKLQKGDILFSNVGNLKSYLINTEIRKKITPSIHTYFIRCTSEKITPEYLFLYLNSKVANKYVFNNKTGKVISFLKYKDFINLPVIIPDAETLDRSKYLFNTLFLEPKEDTIQIINRELFKKDQTKSNILSMFINEYLDKGLNHKLNLMNYIITNDFKEMNKCVNTEAYKSAIILCGSILEALLLDWLSELDEINYIEKNTDMDLYDLIDNIANKKILNKQLEKAAHIIRDKRNYVHPKKYFQSNLNLNRNSVLKDINNLKKIVEKRLENKK